MNIDIRTLVIIVGITNILQIMAIFLQYKANKAYFGIGWWVLGFTSMTLGYAFLSLRNLISIELITIILANALILFGPIFLYIGIMRFLDKKENRAIVISILAVFTLSFIYYTYFDDNITLRTVIVYAAAAIFSLLAAQSLFLNKTTVITTSAYFNASLFLMQGCFFALRAAVTLIFDPVNGLFTATMMQTASFLFLFAQGVLLTFGLIIMVNQRLNAENSEAKKNLELIFNTTPDAVLVSSLTDGVIMTANKAFTTLTGYTHAEAIGKSSMDINVWKNPADRQKLVAMLTEKGFCENMETVFQRKDGSQFTGIISAKIITLQDTPYIISVNRDISKRRKADDMLRLRLELVDFAASHTLEEVLQKTLDQVGELTGSPIGFYHFVESDQKTLSLQAWSTRTLKEFCRAEGKGLHYSIDQAGVWVDCVYSRKPVIHNDYSSLPHRKGMPDGHAAVIRELVVPILRHDKVVSILGIGNKSSDYTTDDADLVAFFADTAWEIANRKHAESALKASESRMRAITDSAQDAILMIDPDGLISYWNPAAERILGYTQAEAIGQNLHNFIVPERYHAAHAAAFPAFQQTGLGGAVGKTLDLDACRKDGTEITVQLSLSAIRIDGAWHAVGILRDITDRKQAEASLRESEERYRTMFENTGTSMILIEEDMTINMANQEFVRNTGYSPDEINGRMKWIDIVHPDDLRLMIDQHRLRRENHEEALPGYEFRYITKTGDLRYASLNIQLVSGTKKSVASLIDITERKQAEAYREMGREVLQTLNEPGNLQESLQRVLATLKTRTGFDAVGIRLQDGDDYPYFAQEGFSSDFLLTENTLVERSADGGMCRDKDGNVSLECTCGLVISSKTGAVHPLLTPGGSFWINDSFPLVDLPADQDPRHNPRNQCMHHGYASMALIPIRNNDRIVGLIHLNDRRKGCFTQETVELLEGIASHIGGALVRKQAEEALKKSEEMLRLITGNMSDMIRVTDLQGNNLYVSPSHVKGLGYRIEERVGKSGFDIVHPDDVEMIMNKYAEGLALNKPLSVQYRVRHADGHYLWLDTVADLLRDDQGKETALVMSSRDITDRKQAEVALLDAKEKAEEANRAKSEFLSIMSHEIRTPLNAIIGMSELLGETELDADQKNYVKAFNSAGESLLGIINNILDYSKIEAGKVELEAADFNLADAVEKISEIMAMQAHRKNIELIVNIMPDLPFNINGDQQRLRQILINLIGNAIKFTEKGEITVKLEKAEGNSSGQECAIKFSVSDTGIGIPQDKLQQIFERFSQADSSVTRKFGGTGLGLAISKKLVELMGGQIHLESEVGKGSTFQFTLKFGLQKNAERKSQELTIDMRGLKVLVVDDNSTNRLIINRTITPWGAAVTEAFDGKDAIKELRRLIKAKSEPYKLIIIDRHMPGMDGFELAEYIRNDPRLSSSVMIMMTSDSFNIDLARVNKFGISGYLLKPVKRLDLKEIIIKSLRMEGLIKEKEDHIKSFDNLKPLRILLVEDAENNRMLIRSYLKKTPFQIEEALNGQIAVDKFKTGNYDIVLMDMQMPVMDGYTATKEIRKWERENGAHKTPIVALTAHVFKEDIDKSLASGCDSHLTKPIKKGDLIDAIIAHVNPGGEK